MNGSVNLVLGLVIILFRGMLTASFAPQMKLSRRWSWENTWLAYATFAFLALTIPHSLAFLGSIPIRVMLPALLFGFTWASRRLPWPFYCESRHGDGLCHRRLKRSNGEISQIRPCQKYVNSGDSSPWEEGKVE